MTRTIRTDRPIEKVSAFLSDFTTTEAWDPGTVTCTQTDPGPVAVGTRFQNTSKFVGRETTLEYVVSELEEGKRIVLDGSNKTVHSKDAMSFLGSGTGTIVTYRAEFTFAGAARFLEPVLKLPLGKLADKAAAGMTEALARL